MLQAIRVFENGMTYEDIQKSPFSMVEQAIRFGAAWQKEKEQQRLHSDENLQALAARYAYEEWNEDLVEVAKDSFIDGYNICKQQMMESAVETKVEWVVKSALQNKLSDIKDDNMDRVEEIKELLQSIFDANYAMVRINGDFKNGEKLKIIVLKEE